MATRIFIKLLISRAMRRDPWIPRVCVADTDTIIPLEEGICDCVHRCKFDPPDASDKAMYTSMYIQENHGRPEHTEYIGLRRMGDTA